MCGIFGYIGKKNAVDIVLEGLRRLEYRGYDSAGIGILDGEGQVQYLKSVGKIVELEKRLHAQKMNSYIGIGHTRWATHGLVTEENSHPHFDTKRQFALVHNGIIENFIALREQLIAEGHLFYSETDTEVLPQLLAKYSQNSNHEEAVIKTMKSLEGSYAFVAINAQEPHRLIAARKGSPLVAGIGQGEFFLASDISAIIPHTRDIIYLADSEILFINQKTGEYYVKNIKGRRINKKVEHVKLSIEAAEKGGHPHFMLKEIYEQPSCIMETLAGRYDLARGNTFFHSLHIPNHQLININRIIITACGTSFHAGVIGKHYLEKYARVPVTVEYAAEFRYSYPVIDEKTLVIAVSQSGETADTLAALQEAKRLGANTLAICNVMGSTITRTAQAIIYTRAGIEIGVASTKAFTTQIVAFYMFAIYLARLQYLISKTKGQKLIKEALKLPKLIKEMFKEEDIIKEIAHKFYQKDHFLYLGRGLGFPLALEGALKMKEISYSHAEGYSAAEMKHGPIALIDANMPAIVLAMRGRRYDKVLGNIAEIKSRHGIVIAIANHGDEEIQHKVDEVIYIPNSSGDLTAVTAAIPLQLLAYHTAVLRGCDVDQPRNLAKSVTVE